MAFDDMLLAPITEIVIRESPRGYRVHPPYKHEQFVRALKGSVSNATWRASVGEWLIPADRLEWVKEILGYWFKLPVRVAAIDPDEFEPVYEQCAWGDYDLG